MYKLVNINSKRRIALATSNELVTLWEMLDNPEYRYKTPVILDDNNNVIAGHMNSFEWAKLKDFRA